VPVDHDALRAIAATRPGYTTSSPSTPPGDPRGAWVRPPAPQGIPRPAGWRPPPLGGPVLSPAEREAMVARRRARLAEVERAAVLAEAETRVKPETASRPAVRAVERPTAPAAPVALPPAARWRWWRRWARTEIAPTSPTGDTTDATA
jgi:hypothetical protein